MSKVECLHNGCHTTFDTEEEFHKHLRTHKISQAFYYQLHFPLYDKYDGSIIQFKNKDYYFNTDFNSRANLISWLKTLKTEEARAYCSSLLTKRQHKKGIKYAPTQVELRTTLMPGMAYYNKLFGSYYELCASLGLICKHKEVALNDLLFNNFNKDHVIYIDTRERQPLSFSIQSERNGLKFGDYRLNDLEFSGNVFIERKSLPDLFGTLTDGKTFNYTRFQKEIERAAEFPSDLVVLVESSLESTYAYVNPSPYAPRPEYIFHNMREIVQKYPHVQFLFVKDRIEAAKAVECIFRSNRQYKDVDLQYMYDTGQLCGMNLRNT